eukprot:CAMPEP_0116913852 /NCGR_PEP_ID=MMETSP0467-20121206/16955_1 /TAXON_ID=283647 /ORGANISM="Mesodinium pulex, Strain SPMC105" /LENGTH=231 /DNA_ID=CAMNT_0004590155 /DNA_START=497 /DNA_END=1192 /DNA_ORIENTATION=-
MGAVAAIGVDDDFAPSEASIGVRPSLHEVFAGVDDETGIFADVLLGHDGFDLPSDGLGDFLIRNVFVVLVGDQDGVCVLGHEHTVFDEILECYLGLGVGAQPLDLARLALGCEVLHDAVGELESDWHELLGFVGGLAEHVALVACAHLEFGLLGEVHSVRDFGRLLVDAHLELECLVVEALVHVVLADELDQFPDLRFEVHLGCGRDLPENHDEVVLSHRLTSDFGVRILS